MLSEFTPEVEQRLVQLRRSSLHSNDFWTVLEVPTNPYLHYIWLRLLADDLSPAEVWQAGRAMSDLDTAEAVKRAARSPLAERLRLARRLQAQQVPRMVEFAQYRLAQEVPKDQLHELLHHVSEADVQDVDFMFTRIADLLLNRLLFCVGTQRYRLREIEFYFRRPGVHDDPYIHGEAEQQQVGRWYYNLAGGLDMTFGRQELGTWGGILLRGVERVLPAPDELGHVQPTKTGYVSGPQNVLRDIIANLNGVFEQPRGLWLDEIYSVPGEVERRVRRYNLKHKPADTDQDFLNRPYRFLADEQYVLSLKPKDQADILSQLPPAT